jgi:cytochrome d ubiquinol oxidase subunit I
VYGLITTAETASSVPAPHIVLTLTAYAILYAALMLSYMVVITQLARKMAGQEPREAALGELRPAKA